MSRAIRTVRGALGAFIATVLAAASHALAGGSVVPLALVVTAVIALPICVALAGSVGSVWRAALAVGASQFFYHWMFSGLGIASGSPAIDPGLGPHAAHLARLEGFAPALGSSGGADFLMFALHGVAAAVTTIVITRGERAILTILRLIARALPKAVERPRIHAISAPRALPAAPLLRNQVLSLTTCPRRGPPLVAG